MHQRVFENYQEFFSLTRPLSDHQIDILLRTLIPSERRRLLRSRKSEGWDDLQIRNKINDIIDQIKEDFDEDLVLIRIKVLSGCVYKVRKAFWDYINDLLAEYPMTHKNFVLGDITTEEHSKDWLILIPSKRRNNGKKEDNNNNNNN